MARLSRFQSDEVLFYTEEWFAVQIHLSTKLTESIQNYDGDVLLNTATEELVDSYVEEYELVVPALHEDQISSDQVEIEIDYSNNVRNPLRFGPSSGQTAIGTAVTFEIPFSGNVELFKVKPTKCDLSPPRGKIQNNTICFSIKGENLTEESLKHDFESKIKSIRNYLGWLEDDARKFNGALEQKARSAIEARKAKLLKDRNLVASLGFPLKVRKNVPSTFIAPEVRKKVRPNKTTTQEAFKPEPTLDEAEYEHILSIIDGMVHVMERSPAAFAGLDEEAIRTHFLVQLNGQYEGQATGETFNFDGKTDILIRSDGKNIFIGECKFWRGEKSFGETIDQLLGYLSWRDAKTGIIVFNRNKKFSLVLDKIEATVPTHSNFKALIKKRSETSWQYRFSHKDDASRELILTVMAFDIPETES